MPEQRQLLDYQRARPARDIFTFADGLIALELCLNSRRYRACAMDRMKAIGYLIVGGPLSEAMALSIARARRDVSMLLYQWRLA